MLYVDFPLALVELMVGPMVELPVGDLVPACLLPLFALPAVGSFPPVYRLDNVAVTALATI